MDACEKLNRHTCGELSCDECNEQRAEAAREIARLREALGLAWRRYSELYSGHGYGNPEETLVAELVGDALGFLPNADSQRAEASGPIRNEGTQSASL